MNHCTYQLILTSLFSKSDISIHIHIHIHTPYPSLIKCACHRSPPGRSLHTNISPMKLSLHAVRSCTTHEPKPLIRCCTTTKLTMDPQIQTLITPPNILERLFLNSPQPTPPTTPFHHFTPTTTMPAHRLHNKWMEYQGLNNWEGLLDPLDDNLRTELIRYGHFVESTYKSFDFDTSSDSYGMSRFSRTSLLKRTGYQNTGYRVTRNLWATSGIQLPHWMERGPSWVGTQSSWIGYVAVCDDKEEISRLGRRDVVVALRGTATCLEWLENLRATLTQIPGSRPDGCIPMVESGFLSLYTSGTELFPSLQALVREEIHKILQMYRNEPLSLTITGHSLGAALAILAAYDIKSTFNRTPLVTVISFGGPRVGNRSFRAHIEKQGTRILRIVNSDDIITKVPGFVIEDDDMAKDSNVHVGNLPSWIQQRVEDTQWVYADVGCELRLSSRDSRYHNGMNAATCHDLKTYLHLVNGFVSSKCPYRSTESRVIKKSIV